MYQIFHCILGQCIYVWSKNILCYCLAFNCLAYPTDLALSYDEKIVYIITFFSTTIL